MKKMAYIDMYRSALQARDIPFSEKKLSDEKSQFKVRLSGEKMTHHELSVYISDTGNFAVRTYLAYDVPMEKRAKMLQILNDLNTEEPFVKFLLDDEFDVCVEYDHFLREGEGENLGKHLFLVTGMCAQLADNAAPKVLPFMWNEDDVEDTDMLQSMLDTLMTNDGNDTDTGGD